MPVTYGPKQKKFYAIYKNTLAYFAKAICYACKMFMKLTPGGKV
jgi:hypothetical protein